MKIAIPLASVFPLNSSGRLFNGVHLVKTDLDSREILCVLPREAICGAGLGDEVVWVKNQHSARLVL
jgi:hypothetical protein